MSQLTESNELAIKQHFARLLLFGLGVTVIGTQIACLNENEDFFGVVEIQRPLSQLNTIVGTEPKTIDPGLSQETSGGFLVRNLFAGLVQPNPKTLKPEPDLATDWIVEDNGQRYTFNLRENLTWSDGHPLTADDFVWSMLRVLDPQTRSVYANFFYSLLNADAFHGGAIYIKQLTSEVTKQILEEKFSKNYKVKNIRLSHWPEANGAFVWLDEKKQGKNKFIDEFNGKRVKTSTLSVSMAQSSVVGIRKLSPTKIEFRLSGPIPYFLHQLAFYTALPAPRHVMERLAKEGKNPRLWTRPEHIVTNGPYKLTAWKFRQKFVLEKNPRYWMADKISIDKVNIDIVENSFTVMNMYRMGLIDWIGSTSGIPSEYLSYMKKRKDYHHSFYLAVYYYLLNVNKPPLDDVRVRKALYLSIKRSDITEYILRGGQIPTGSMVSGGLDGYPKLDNKIYDLKQAKQLLAEAGYPNGEGLPEIELMYNTSEGHKQIAEAVQQMWKKDLGVRVRLRNMEWNVYLGFLQKKDFQVARMAWVGDYPDPYTFLSMFLSNSENNRTGWANARYDQLLAQANLEPDAAKRLYLLAEAEKELLAEIPAIPIYQYSRGDLVKPYVRGFYSNVENIHPIKYMSIDGKFSHSQQRDL